MKTLTDVSINASMACDEFKHFKDKIDAHLILLPLIFSQYNTQFTFILTKDSCFVTSYTSITAETNKRIL